MERGSRFPIDIWALPIWRTCKHCGKRFTTHGELKNYIYKICVSNKGKPKFHVCCSWNCFKPYKTQIYQEFLVGERKISNVSIDEAMNWLQWAGSSCPTKAQIEVIRAKCKKRKSCSDVITINYECIESLNAKGVDWDVIREKVGLSKWTTSYIQAEFYRIKESGVMNE